MEKPTADAPVAPANATADTAAGAPAWTPYQKRLFFFLSVATFFEGYDYLALPQILPNLRQDLGLSPSQGFTLIGVINIGMVLAYLLVRQADVWGRKRVLSLTIVGYAASSFLTALMPNAIGFALCQLLARAFLIGEWAVAMVYAAEEFPAARRGAVIGLIQACSSIGAITCAGLVPILLKTSIGWRSVFVVGSVPLLLIAIARRNLRETARFTALSDSRPTDGTAPGRSLFRIFSAAPQHRHRVYLMAAIWGLTYICTANAQTFWKEFAVHERGFTDAQVGGSVTIAALASMPLLFYTGRMLDRLGRRRGALIIFGSAAVSTFLSYTLQARWALTLSMTVTIFGISAVLPVLNAYNTELFPTDLRSDALAWANNLLGRLAQVLSPMLLGLYANQYGWGKTIAATTICPILAVTLILWRLPETTGLELEQTARVD